MGIPSGTGRVKLDFHKLEEALAVGELVDVSLLDAEHCATNLSSKIIEVCGTETEPRSKRKSVYWWTPELNSLRRTANHTHRVVQRKKRIRGIAEFAVEIETM